MKTFLLLIVPAVIAVTFFLLLGPSGRGQELPEHVMVSQYQRAARELAASLEEGKESSLVEGIDRAVKFLPETSYIAVRLQNLKQKIVSNPGLSSDAEVISSLKMVVEDLRFRPLMEAPLPEGFPPCTPVGEVEVKRYPPHRAAVTIDNGMAFWRLFAHIKKNHVAMTAPVEMTLDERGQRSVLMAFLYERPDQGTVGQQGSVEVRDQPGGWYASTGMRGPRTDQAMRAAQQRLQEWLTTQGDRWEIVGPPRLLGYNSPFVPRHQNYWEYQIPVREKSSGR